MRAVAKPGPFVWIDDDPELTKLHEDAARVPELEARIEELEKENRKLRHIAEILAET